MWLEIIGKKFGMFMLYLVFDLCLGKIIIILKCCVIRFIEILVKRLLKFFGNCF